MPTPIEQFKEFFNANAEQDNIALSKAPGAMWMGKGQENAIKTFHIAAETVPAYKDFLRQHNIAIWVKDDPKMRALRALRIMREPTPHIPQYPHIPHNPELAANLMVMLCQRTTYLLEKQIESLKEKFIKEGGFRENLFKERMKYKILIHK